MKFAILAMRSLTFIRKQMTKCKQTFRIIRLLKISALYFFSFFGKHKETSVQSNCTKKTTSISENHSFLGSQGNEITRLLFDLHFLSKDLSFLSNE